MTWVITTPENDTESDERVHATAALAVIAVDTLQASVDLLEEIATAGPAAASTWETEATFRAGQLVQVRASLIETFKIHKERLPKSVTDDLREGFRLAELGEADQAAERQKLCQEVVGHEVEALAELSSEEAKAIRARLTEMEPKF